MQVLVCIGCSVVAVDLSAVLKKYSLDRTPEIASDACMYALKHHFEARLLADDRGSFWCICRICRDRCDTGHQLRNHSITRLVCLSIADRQRTSINPREFC